MKTKFKIILMAIIMLLAILFIGNSKVQAATYKETIGNTEITVVTENKKVTITQKYPDMGTSIIELENLEEVIGLKSGSLVMSQANINKFLEPRGISRTIKQKVDNSVNKAEAYDGTELTIEVINNEKWVVYKDVFQYDAYDMGKGELGDPCIVGYKNNDIRSVILGTEGIPYYINGNRGENVSPETIWDTVSIETEKTVGAGVSYMTDFANERDITYEWYGGKGGFESGYIMLNPIYDLTKFRGVVSMIPEKADLSKVYLKLSISAYQGESIVLKNGKGTLYYEGREYGNSGDYIYKNKLSNLKIKENEIAEFSYKLTNGYQMDGHLNVAYRLDPNAVETVVKVEDSTKNEQKVNDKVGINYWGDAKFNVVSVEKNDSIYTRVENEINRKLMNGNNTLYLDILDIYRVEGNYGGKLTITFNVDKKYNGKYYYITHNTRFGEFESFTGVIEKGKITITVDSLSPFGIAIYEKKPSTSTGDRELDNEPATGINTMSTVITTTLAVITIGALIIAKNRRD